MAQNIVGTAPIDSDFYSRKVAMLGDAIGTMRARAEERRQRRDLMDMAEIERFRSAAEGMPELAATWGAEIKSKYGEKYPWAAALVDAISKRNEIPQMIDRAGSEFAGRVDALEQQHKRRSAEVAGMPDTVPVMPPPAGPFSLVGGALAPMGIPQAPIHLPNPEKQKAQAELGSVDPAFIPFMAAQEMPYQQRLAAGLWAKQRGAAIPAPSGFDPFGDDLSDQDKMGLAVQRGYINGEAAEAWRVRSKLKQSPARIQEQGYQEGERESRETFTEKQRLGREAANRESAGRKLANDKARLDYADRLQRARQDRSQENQKELIQLRGNDADESPDSVKGIGKQLASDSKAAQKSYDSELRQALTGLIDQTSITEAKRNFVREHGTRPQALTNIQARVIERTVRDRIKAGEISEDEAEQAASDVTASFMAATGRGIPAEKAIRVAVGQEAAPRSTPLETARDKVKRIKAGGDVDAERGAEPEAAAEAAPAGPDPARVRAIIRRANPNWTDAQVDAKVNEYLAHKGGG